MTACLLPSFNPVRSLPCAAEGAVLGGEYLFYPWVFSPTSPVQLDIQFVADVVSTADATIYTFSDVSLGPPHNDRVVVVGISVRAGTAPAISSVTIGGVSASSVVQVASSAGSLSRTALFAAIVPNGIVGDVVVTISTASVRCGIGAWSLYGMSATASDTGTSTADPATATLTVPVGGACIGYGFAAHNAALTATWTGVSEDFDEAVEATFFHTGAHTSNTGSIDVACDWSVTPATGAGVVFASFGP